MAVRDRELLQRCQHTKAQAGQVLNKSRQAISQGVKGEGPYFGADEVKRLYQHAAVTSEEEREELRQFIRASFEEFADRILVSDSELKMASAIKTSETLWIIAPNLSSNLAHAEGQMEELVNLLEKRSKLDVVLFAEKESDAAAFESRLSDDWFSEDRENELFNIDCRVVEKQLFMVISAPKDTPQCFILAEPHFALVPSHEGVRMVNSLVFEIRNWIEQEEKKATEEAQQEAQDERERMKAVLN